MAMPADTTSLQPCTQCGARLPLDSTAGLCAACLVRMVTEENNDWNAASAADGKTATPFVPRVGLTIGDYCIEAPLGEGGMGVVYRARQISLNRVVALKMLPFGRLAPDAHLQRFRSEAEAIACLRHPNIVTVFEAGEHEGQPFLSMEFVDGPDLARVLRERTLTVREAATLVARVARAIHYAHERGVAHRDLKPSNILLEADGQPRVTDFGLAKNLASDRDLTLTGQAIGSPHYIPPEQADGRRDAPFPASDVYGLGAILYHVLTGRPPFIGETVSAVLQQLAQSEPVPPRLLNPAVPRDLETICLTSLEKEVAARYTTAGELADELERFVHDEPIHARPITAIERAWRWCRRRPALAGLSAGLALTLCAGLATSTVLWQREQRRAEEATANLLRVELARAEDLFERGDAPEALARLARLHRAQPDELIVAQRIMSALTHRSFVVPASEEFEDAHEGRILTLALAGDRLVTATDGGTKLTVWNAARGLERVLEIPLPAQARVTALSNDAQQIAVVLQDRTLQVWSMPPTVGSSLATTAARASASPTEAQDPTLQTTTALTALPTALQFDAAGARLLALSEPTGVDLIDATTGRVVKQFVSSHFAEFSPDGRWLVTAADEAATVWRLEDLSAPVHALRHAFRLETARFSRDSTRVVTASADQTACIWDVATGQRTGPALLHAEHVLDAVLSPDGQRMLTVSLSARGQLWDAVAGKPLGASFPHWRQLHPAQFSPDGLRLVQHYYNRVWVRDAFSGAPVSEALRLAGSVSAVRYLDDGQRIATTNHDGRARLWDVRAGEAPPLLLRHNFEVIAAAFSPDGTRVLTCAKDQTARTWSAIDGRALGPALRHERRLTCGAFDATGTRVASGDFNGVVQVWDSTSGQRLAGPWQHRGEIVSVAFSRDGRAVIAAAASGTLHGWDVASGALRWEASHGAAIRALAISSDGQHAATAGEDSELTLWSVADGRRLAQFAHDAAVWCAAFSPDGQQLAAGDRTGVVRWWDLARQQAIGAPARHTAAVVALRFSRDGRMLATASWDQTARVWDGATHRAVAQPLAHRDRVAAIAFSPDGRHVATGSLDNTARIWDARTGRPVGDALPHGSQVIGVEFAPDGTSLVTASWDGCARVWSTPFLASPSASPWLADAAEAIGGLQLADDEIPQLVAADAFNTLAHRASDADGANDDADIAAWLQWLTADRATRPIAPGGSITAIAAARAGLDDESADRLRASLRFLPMDGVALARWSRQVLQQTPERNPRRIGEAAFAAQLAVSLEPEKSETWSALAEVQAAAGNVEEARETGKRAAALASPGSEPEFGTAHPH